MWICEFLKFFSFISLFWPWAGQNFDCDGEKCGNGVCFEVYLIFYW